MPGDMIVNDFLACPLAIHSTDFGIIEDVDVVKTDNANDIVSRHFKIQIRDFADLEKIKMPKVTHNAAATEFRYRAMCRVYEGIMPVKKMGQTHIWFTPWDYLIRWWGIQEAMVDMIERPELVHAGVERMVDAWMVELDQFVAQNLLSLDCNNTRIGSGGYGYTNQLPGPDCDPNHIKPHNMWGCSNAQIFSEVSPRMHWEFALEHDLRWLSRWGLTITAAASRWTGRSSCCDGFPICGKSRSARGATRSARSSRSAVIMSSAANRARRFWPKTTGIPNGPGKTSARSWNKPGETATSS